ncbi:hypothetical protein SAMN05877753_1067 [Bacillus oleivorans]|uniref:Uncharacterized protein n=1 Tax=Bacillus oleivorans TaxID=1448271 RepID=A0A285CXK3_9BACI|nr:hypothetical protein [Bacillus oleivorans]SNX72270.1 hypothetical protein SAMN05877753_1067 [Bacillus oleivorans]
MQKNYREFTVGELLDLGFDVEVSKHQIKTEEEGKQLAQLFEGTKQSTTEIMKGTFPFRIVKAWKEKFHAKFFVREEMK